MSEQNAQRYQILASDAETGGAFGLMSCTLPPFSLGPSVHRHRVTLEGCLVLSGTVAMTVDEATTVLAAGELRLLLPGQAHTWWNPGPVPAQLLLIFAPGGNAERLLRLAGGEHRSGPWDTS